MYTDHFLLSHLQGLLDTPASNAIGDDGEDQEGEVDGKHEAKDNENKFCQFVPIDFFSANHELLHQRAHQKQESLRTELNKMACHLGEHLPVPEQVR